jgi:hypothetical protein
MDSFYALFANYTKKLGLFLYVYFILRILPQFNYPSYQRATLATSKQHLLRVMSVLSASEQHWPGFLTVFSVIGGEMKI